MGNSKFLSDGGWKDIASKTRIKDNGLLKVLSDHKRLGEEEHDDVLESLDQILKLAGQLKKAKDVGAASAALKYVSELSDAAESERKLVVKAKAEADKKGKLEAEAAKKREQDKGSKEEGEDEEDEEASTLLTTKMVPLLRMVNKGETMHSLVATTGKQVVVMLSRKPISPARRKLLAEELGGAGGIKYIVGHCVREQGMTTFALKTQVAGMAKKLKLALLAQTGLRVKLRCRGEDGETDDDLDEPDEPAADEADGEDDGASPELENAQREDDPTPRFVPGVDGGEEPPKFVPGVEADVPADEAPAEEAPQAVAPPVLGKGQLSSAPAVWHDTRDILGKNIGALKSAVVAHYGREHVDFGEIEDGMRKLDSILENLDAELAESLAKAHAATDDAERKAELKNAKGILTGYMNYVKSEPLIAHIDANPFGIDTNLKKVLIGAITHVAQAIS
jgi:hypothetical protein